MKSAGNRSHRSQVLRVALSFFAASGLVTSAVAQTSLTSTSTFGLHDGDRVTFYGDSITEQRQYTEDVEEFVLTRFPRWKLDFHNAGVGGDRVIGGHAGPVDLRLDRDVIPAKPTVITIMLGMNDGSYRASEPGIYESYTAGYRHIVERMQKELPQARITLIQPSPYDDVTRPTEYEGGYNSVLLKYGAFLADLSQEKKTQLADLNNPVTAVLKTLNEQSPALAPQLIPDRVHPQQAGHWLMAGSLLKSWAAPALVSQVSVDATGKGSAEAKNAQVTELRRIKDKAGERLVWTETEDSLPLPIPPAALDPVLGLVLKNSDLLATLDQEMLQMRGLTAGNYDLLIDGRKIGVFSADTLSAGVNLATLQTPMLEQSLLVALDTEKKNTIEAARFDIIYRSLAGESSPTAAALDAALPAAVAQQRADAQPRPHHYEVMKSAQ